MTNNNKGNVIVFEVGPSVKFVSAMKDAIFNKKGSLAKDQTFSGFFFSQPSLRTFKGEGGGWGGS